MSKPWHIGPYDQIEHNGMSLSAYAIQEKEGGVVAYALTLEAALEIIGPVTSGEDIVISIPKAKSHD